VTADTNRGGVNSDMSTSDPASDLAALEDTIASYGSVLVALSGGVDSSVVAAAAARALGSRALSVTAISPALATGELDAARDAAVAAGIAHETIATNELEREAYRQNGPDRCYHCKSELYVLLGEIARERGIAVVASGANRDDLGDWRPGLRAAAEHEVRHPLVERDLGKGAVRAIAHRLGLPTADKPASPCLASRLPYGTPVDAETLHRIDRAETAVRALGYRELRVRHLEDGALASVELGTDDLTRLRAADADGLGEAGSAVVEAVRQAGGYERVEIAAEALRSGSLSAVFLGGLGRLPRSGPAPAPVR
jgi:uncharacterized protein